MNKGTVLALLVVVLGGGYGLGALVDKDKGGDTRDRVGREAVGGRHKNDRRHRRRRRPRPRAARGRGEGPGGREGDHRRVLRLPVPVLQPRASRRWSRSRRSTASKVRVVFRHNPLPFHPDAPLAAEARDRGRGAGQVLGDARQAVRQPAEPRSARPREVRAGDRPRRGQVQGGARQRHGQGAHRRPTWRWPSRSARNGTPTFFINGRNLSGAQPFEKFKKIIDEELERADKLIAKGDAAGPGLRRRS